jgi:hypothetical protein
MRDFRLSPLPKSFADIVVFTDVSGQPIGPAFPFEGGTDRLFGNVGNYKLPCVKIVRIEYFSSKNNTTESACSLGHKMKCICDV